MEFSQITSKVVEALPFIIHPAIVMVSATVGIYLLTSSREKLVDQYTSLFYSLTNQHPEEYGVGRVRSFVVTSRVIGGVAVAFSLLMAFVTYQKYLGDIGV